MNIKVTNTTHVVADLVTQNTCVTSGASGTLKTMLQASSATIAPYSETPLTVTVSEVSTDASGNATVTWSQSLNGTARTVGQPVTLPTSMQVDTQGDAKVARQGIIILAARVWQWVVIPAIGISMG